MRQVFVIFLSIFASISLFAETYTVIAYKNCSLTYKGNPIQIGDKVSAPTNLKIHWVADKGSKYVKLQSTSDKKIQIITQPSQNNKANDESFLTWLWGCFSGQKKCSTRAPENELAGGLASNLSQTFYLLYSTDTSEKNSFSFASNLDEGSKLRCSYTFQGNNYAFDIPLIDNRFEFIDKYFNIPIVDEDRYVLRLNVEYISPDGNNVHLTNSMNVILIPE